MATLGACPVIVGNLLNRVGYAPAARLLAGVGGAAGAAPARNLSIGRLSRKAVDGSLGSKGGAA